MLMAYLQQEAAQAFSWGRHDCATLAIGWADRVTGSSHLEAWRGWYGSEDSCRAFIEASGGFSAIARAFVARCYGLPLSTLPKAGNVVLAAIGPSHLMGIRTDARSAAFRLEGRGIWITRKFESLEEWTCRLSS